MMFRIIKTLIKSKSYSKVTLLAEASFCIIVKKEFKKV